MRALDSGAGENVTKWCVDSSGVGQKSPVEVQVFVVIAPPLKYYFIFVSKLHKFPIFFFADSFMNV
jgi:hypothetical protein